MYSNYQHFYLLSHQCYRVDRTYKIYYGGAQKRPDGQYSRPVANHAGKVVAHVGDGNRKDLRNAVECAHSAAPGYDLATFYTYFITIRIQLQA